MRAVATLLFCHTFDREDVGIHELVLHPDSSVTFTVDPGYKSDKIGDQLWSNQPFTFESRLQIGRGSIAVYTFFTRLIINFIRIEYVCACTRIQCRALLLRKVEIVFFQLFARPLHM